MAREGHLDGLADLRDELDRQGMRIVIELTKNADANIVLHDLYRRTPMQTTFSINLLALVDGEPRTLTLKQALRVYIEHRLTVIKRRAEFDLDKAKQRAHILEGYMIALKNLDEVVQLIRSAPDVETARSKLMKRYKLSELQANAILDLQLRRLAALERKKIETEYKEVTATIKDLTDLLKSAKRMRGVVADELSRVKEAFGDRRRTQIVNLKGGAKGTKALTASDLLPEQHVWIGVTSDGLVGRTHDDKPPRHSGADAPRWLVRASTSDTIYFISKAGKGAAVATHVIPEIEKLGDGSMFFKVSPLTENDSLAAVFALPAKKSAYPEETCVITATRFGMIKKSLITELPGPSSQTFTLVKINEGDRLVSVALTDGKKKDVLLATALGMAIRFSEEDVRPMGLIAAGVNGMKLDDKDEVVGMEIFPIDGEALLMTSDGKAKRIEPKEFPSQGRYGKGVSVWSLSEKVKLVGIVSGKPNEVATIHMSKGAAKSARLDAAAIRKRAATKGDVMVEVKPGEEVTSVSTGWMVEKFVKTAKAEKPAKKKATAKKAAVKKAITKKATKPAKKKK